MLPHVAGKEDFAFLLGLLGSYKQPLLGLAHSDSEFIGLWFTLMMGGMKLPRSL